MFHLTARWKRESDTKILIKTFESHEDTPKEAIHDVVDQLFAGLAYKPDTISFRFEEEPSRAYQQLRGCTGKKDYFDLAKAQADADSMNRNRRADQPKEAPYKCEFCRRIHVGASKFPNKHGLPATKTT
jgi:hypothetical protein